MKCLEWSLSGASAAPAASGFIKAGVKQAALLSSTSSHQQTHKHVQPVDLLAEMNRWVAARCRRARCSSANMTAAWFSSRLHSSQKTSEPKTSPSERSWHSCLHIPALYKRVIRRSRVSRGNNSLHSELGSGREKGDTFLVPSDWGGLLLSSHYSHNGPKIGFPGCSESLLSAYYPAEQSGR